ncbi:hypothetical protein BDF19DRAFT_384495 [Syncephalis fuscata]|nr:hypothetical protein BDF19DRAFT_384495 [Syncephalis fuscata]
MQLVYAEVSEPELDGPVLATAPFEPTAAATDLSTDAIVVTAPEDEIADSVLVELPTTALKEQLVTQPDSQDSENSQDGTPLVPANPIVSTQSDMPFVTSTETPAVSSSIRNDNARDNEEDSTDEYKLKPIEWQDPITGYSRVVHIITQNKNGPCPLLAICNVLILRGEIEIQSPDRPTVSASYLIALLGDRLLQTLPTNTSDDQMTDPTNDQVILQTVLGLLPSLQYGLDVDVKFSSPRGFANSNELLLFQTFGVELVHGWCVDPAEEETWQVMCHRCESYNAIVELIAQGDHAGKGLVVDGVGQRDSSRDDDIIEMDGAQRMNLSINRSLVNNRTTALIAQQFLESNPTQLTFYGLQMLSESIPAGNLCILFRNNHFATLFKHPNQTLYLLVTDAGLATQSSAIWEVLSDVHGATSELVDSKFQAQRVVNDYVSNRSDIVVHSLDAE